MRKRDEKFYNDPWERDSYETGSTRPPKQRGGLVAFLLVLVILLGGLCSTLGIINHRLLRQLAEGGADAETVDLFQASEPGTEPSGSAEVLGGDEVPQLGIQGQTVSDFDRRFYELPRGVLITEVAADRCADLAGIRAGDVIMSLAGRDVSNHQELADALDGCATGQKVKVELYRQETREALSVTVTIEEEKD